MPHVPQNFQVGRNWGVTQLATQLQKLWIQLAKVINNHISFGNPNIPAIQGGVDNIDGAWLKFTVAVANTDITLNHNLNRVPVGFIVMNKSAACDVYQGAAAWTATQITLRGSVAGATITVFVV